MIDFRIVKKSKRSRARIGEILTPHGVVETPALVVVATQGSVRMLTLEEAAQAGSQILIANTFHLHLKPGEKIVKNHGGIHRFMKWSRPLMTDSGGFQVFSLGFGRDLGIGKKTMFGARDKKILVQARQNPKEVKITPHGVYFRSPLDGRKLFLGPKESIGIQEALGADIMFAFDECTPPRASREYVKRSLKFTHRWAEESIAARKTDQALYGIVQGSSFKDLREESARYVGSMNFDGFGIGGDLGESKTMTRKILSWVVPHLKEKKPRHLLGIGKLEDMEMIIKEGMDTFDCTVPTHYARHGVAFTYGEKLDLRKIRYLKEKGPLEKRCKCEVCQTHSRGYLCHLVRSSELTGLKLLTLHNVSLFHAYVEQIKNKIKKGKI